MYRDNIIYFPLFRSTEEGVGGDGHIQCHFILFMTITVPIRSSLYNSLLQRAGLFEPDTGAFKLLPFRLK